jgi:PAS domain S-box-containing protein
VVSLLGLLALGAPVYDAWTDARTGEFGVAAGLAENAVPALLALGLVYGGVWLARREWTPAYKLTVVKWNLGVVVAVVALYGLVIGLQLRVAGGLDPWVLALDGVLFGAAAAFGVGAYDARGKRVRDDLERSREEYRALTDDVLDTSEVATFVLDSEFRIAWINRATEEYFGVERGAVLGRDKRELIASELAGRFEDPKRFRERVTATYDDNTDTEEFECHMTGEGIEERWLEHWSRPVESGRYEGGRIEHYTDITSLKRRERELDRRERKLRELYEVSADASLPFAEQVERIVAIGQDLVGAAEGSFVRVGEEGEGVGSLGPGSPETGVVEDEHRRLRARCERAVLSEGGVRFGTRPGEGSDGADGDGGFRTYVGAPVYEHDNVYGVLCFLGREDGEPAEWERTMVELLGNWLGYELNRRRLLEDQQRRLHEQAAKLSEVVETVDDYAIFTLDGEGVVTSWNAGAERIKGYTADEIVGEHFRTFYTDADRRAGVPESLLREAVETGQADHEGWRVRKDGTRFWADVTIAARYRDGEHVGYTKVVEDLTERRERERTLEHERERLEFMNRIIRHNILNGLNVVGARAEFLAAEHVDDPAAADHLETVRRRVDDLTDVIETMRMFMNAVLQDADHETEPVALREALERKVSLARDSYPEADFDTHDLPAESATVVADDLLGEVFENVLSNAVVHNEGTAHVEVWTTETTRAVAVDPETGAPVPEWRDRSGQGTERRERPAIRVHIADDGPGIPDEQKESILEKGVSELSEPGNGFGLYLVKEMMAAYGGAVRVRDYEPTGGTEFELVFLRAE